MAPRSRALVLALLVLLLPARSRAGDWYEDYLDGVRAVETGQWQAAVRLLEAARAKEPKASAQKRAYGVRFIEYVPQHYLGLAYLGLEDRRRALDHLEQAERDGEVLKTKQSEAFRRALARARTPAGEAPAMTPAATPAPPRPTPEPVESAAPPVTRTPATPTPRAPAENVAFVAAQRKADAAESARRLVEAIASLESAQQADPVAFEKQGLEPRLSGLRERVASARRLVGEAAGLVAAGNLGSARERLDTAERMTTGIPEAAGVRAEIGRRAAEYRRLRAVAERDERAGHSEAAASAYERAREMDPQSFETERLGKRLRELRASAPLTPPTAATPASAVPAPSVVVPGTPVPAPSVVVASGTPAPTSAPAAGASPTPASVPLGELRSALRILFGAGDVHEAVASLETLARTAPRDADVHGFLGAAYAKAARLSEDPGARDRLERQAVDEFRAAIATRPDFALPERLVSPAVRDLLARARSRP